MFRILFIKSPSTFRNKSQLQGILESRSFSEKKNSVSVLNYMVSHAIMV